MTGNEHVLSLLSEVAATAGLYYPENIFQQTQTHNYGIMALLNHCPIPAKPPDIVFQSNLCFMFWYFLWIIGEESSLHNRVPFQGTMNRSLVFWRFQMYWNKEHILRVSVTNWDFRNVFSQVISFCFWCKRGRKVLNECDRCLCHMHSKYYPWLLRGCTLARLAFLMCPHNKHTFLTHNAALL